jgi:hypothetical protein
MVPWIEILTYWTVMWQNGTMIFMPGMRISGGEDVYSIILVGYFICISNSNPQKIWK